jgi:hypothetical protein
MNICLFKRALASLMLLLSSVIFGAGCIRQQHFVFELTETGRDPKVETYDVIVDNCEGVLPKVYLYSFPFAGGGMGAENLKPNGGEPFTSIRQQVAHAYGNQASSHVVLTAPPGSRREFRVRGDIVVFKGRIDGNPILLVNQIDRNSPVLYYYPFLAGVEVEAEQEVPCS